jgi:hypothetical protein
LLRFLYRAEGVLKSLGARIQMSVRKNAT